ncbi:hypothetical protein GALL_476500 [mine drainage metagenome]|uniref:Uncharacterized protein n=1 Tax=mine drainage metagenome TaxID=410659 RepID=A0A1J5PH15_9ZZZZ
MPDRHLTGIAETVPDLRLGQVGGQRQCRRRGRGKLWVGGVGEGPAFGVVQLPLPGQQRGRAGLDPLCGPPLRVKRQEGRRAQLSAIAAGMLRPDHSLPLWPALAQPRPFAADRGHARGTPVRVVVLQCLVRLRGCRHEGVHHRHPDHPDRQRCQHWRHQTAQARPPGCAHHHQFAGPRQPQKQDQRRQNRHQRQDAVEPVRRVERRQPRRLHEGDRASRRAVNLFHQIQQHQNRPERARHSEECHQKLASDVKAQRHDAYSPRIAGRRAGCSDHQSSATVTTPPTREGT